MDFLFTIYCNYITRRILKNKKKVRSVVNRNIMECYVVDSRKH